MEKLAKILAKTVVVGCYANRGARRALEGIETVYGEMLREMRGIRCST